MPLSMSTLSSLLSPPTDRRDYMGFIRIPSPRPVYCWRRFVLGIDDGIGGHAGSRLFYVSRQAVFPLILWITTYVSFLHD